MIKTLSIITNVPFTFLSKGIANPKYKTNSKVIVHSRTKSSSHPIVFLKSKFLVVFTYALIALNGSLLITHVIWANTNSIKGYEVTQLRSNLVKLQEQNKKLVLKTSETVSMGSVEQIVSASDFVPVKETEFINQANTTVSFK